MKPQKNFIKKTLEELRSPCLGKLLLNQGLTCPASVLAGDSELPLPVGAAAAHIADLIMGTYTTFAIPKGKVQSRVVSPFRSIDALHKATMELL